MRYARRLKVKFEHEKSWGNFRTTRGLHVDSISDMHSIF